MKDNRRSAWRYGAVALAMFGFGFALVPFYGAMCRAAGLQVPDAAVASAPVYRAAERYVTVRFDARVQSDLPWEFVPEQPAMRVKVGQWQETRFKVRNLTDHTIIGQAVPSIVPWQATPFFSKAECFCFRQQTVPGGEARELPLRFVVSPDLPREVKSLTVAYAFMALR